MSYPLLTALTAASLFIGWCWGQLTDETAPVRLENAPWCLLGEFRDLDSIELPKDAPEALVDVLAGGKVRVFVRCDD